MKLLAFALTSFSVLSIASADISVVDNDQKIAVDCAKDPNVSIMGNKATITLNGTCKKVSISGNKATVTGSATLVSVTGNENTATLDAVDILSVPGNKNVVTYKKTVDPKLKKTKVATTGNDNKVTQAK